MYLLLRNFQGFGYLLLKDYNTKTSYKSVGTKYSNNEQAVKYTTLTFGIDRPELKIPTLVLNTC